MAYLEARKEWMERYGTYINQAKNWRLVAVLSICLAIIMGIGFYTQAVRTHVVPYVVYVNNAGNMRDIKLLRPLTANAGLSPLTIRYYINQYIDYTFSNVASRIATKQRLNKILTMSLPAAKTVVIRYLKIHNPFLESHIRLVKVHYILQKGSLSSYRVSFSVLELGPHGNTLSEANYIGLVGVAVIPPTTLKVAGINPLGIYFKYFTYTKA